MVKSLNAETKGAQNDDKLPSAGRMRRLIKVFTTLMAALQVPYGYQDRTGFHFGTPTGNCE